MAVVEPKVLVLTLNWNGEKWLREFLDSVSDINYGNYEILIIDNDSSDKSVDLIKHYYPEIKLIINKENLGYSRGFNVGIDYALGNGFDYILIVNNDTVIDKNSLSELVSTAEEDVNIAFVTGKVYFYEKPNIFQSVGRHSDPNNLIGGHVGWGEEDRSQYETVRDYDFVDDIFLLVRSSVVAKVGGYDPDFFLQYEETDWCFRVRMAGHRIVYNPRAKIWHKVSSSTGGSYNPLYAYYRPKNRTIFFKKNGTSNQFTRHIFTQLFIVTPQKIMLFILKSKYSLIKPYFKGLFDGYIWCIQR